MQVLMKVEKESTCLSYRLKQDDLTRPLSLKIRCWRSFNIPSALGCRHILPLVHPSDTSKRSLCRETVGYILALLAIVWPHFSFYDTAILTG